MSFILVTAFTLTVMPSDAQAKSISGAGAGSIISTSKVMTEGVPAGLILEQQHKPFLFWVALEAGRLYLLERMPSGNYIQRDTVPISIGKQGFGKALEGDQRTPVGVYQITSFLSDEQLDSKYGLGAYPLNYPNSFDRLMGRSGSGIWLHGLPKGIATRPRLDSDGCIVINNETLKNYAEFIEPGESVFVLSKQLNWLPAGGSQPNKDVLGAINHWQASWTALDNKAYLDNYHEDFRDAKRRDLAHWKKYKTLINKYKRYIKVKLSNMTVIAYPGEEDLVMHRFYQTYQSSNFNWQGWKQILWRRDATGTWRIIYEGNG